MKFPVIMFAMLSSNEHPIHMASHPDDVQHVVTLCKKFATKLCYATLSSLTEIYP